MSYHVEEVLADYQSSGHTEPVLLDSPTTLHPSYTASATAESIEIQQLQFLLHELFLYCTSLDPRPIRL